MSNDRWGCKADYEHEITGIAERERHDNDDCPAWCGYCLEDRERGAGKLGEMSFEFPSLLQCWIAIANTPGATAGGYLSDVREASGESWKTGAGSQSRQARKLRALTRMSK